jgi:predicted nucleotidyltransferase
MPTQIRQLLENKRSEIADLCRRHRVRRLALFGSALGDDFDPARSDVDLLVEFLPLRGGEQAPPYFELLLALEQLFGRRVDLLDARSLKNPFIRRDIEATQEELYAA